MNYGEKGDDADSDTDIYVHTYLSAATTADGVVIVDVAVVAVVVKGSLRLVPLLKSGCSVLRRPRVDTEYIAELVVVVVGPVATVVLAATTGLGL
jgi:hypothetical protein